MEGIMFSGLCKTRNGVGRPKESATLRALCWILNIQGLPLAEQPRHGPVLQDQAAIYRSIIVMVLNDSLDQWIARASTHASMPCTHACMHCSAYCGRCARAFS